MPAIRVATTVALCVTILLASVASAASPRVERSAYFGNNDLLPLTEFDNICAGGQDNVELLNEVGGACFQLDGSESRVRVTIDDEMGHRVGATYSFTTEDGRYVAGSFCESTSLTVPSGAYLLSIAVNGPYRGPLTCVGSTGVGTSGVVTAEFS